jgi:hypothetical protein
MTQPTVPGLASLLTRYLQNQTAAHEAGLGRPLGAWEVVPFEAAAVQPIEPRVAWNYAVAACRWYGTAQSLDFDVPPSWAELVANQAPSAAVALCLGNYPQLLRQLNPLVQESQLASLRPNAGDAPLEVPMLEEWSRRVSKAKPYPGSLLAAGVLRLARHYALAEEVLNDNRSRIPPEMQNAWRNEQAALAFHRGRVEEAGALWEAQPLGTSVLFNRGTVALFCDRAQDAVPMLNQAASLLPEESTWHHLAKLYAALAEMRV